MIDKDMAKDILILLGRVTLQGNEVERFVEINNRLSDIIEDKEVTKCTNTQ